MPSPSPRQKQQRNLRQALGTVMGFNGYLMNLEHVLNSTELYNSSSHHAIRHLQTALTLYRRDIEARLKQMKDETT